MIFIIIDIVVFISLILSSLVPYFWSIILLYPLYVVMISLLIFYIVWCISEKFKNKINIIGIILLIILILTGNKLFTTINNVSIDKHQYKKIETVTRENFGTDLYFYPITNKIEEDNAMFDESEPKYLVEVKNKKTNVSFHAGICLSSGPFASEYVCNDYIYHYLPYYLSLYNKEHNTKIIMTDNDTIGYTDDNRKDVADFISYLFDNTKEIEYKYYISIEKMDKEPKFYDIEKDDNIYKSILIPEIH